MTTNRKPDLVAYTVTGDDDNAFWTRIGSVWAHRRGEGLTLDLAALPVNGRVVLMPPKAAKDLTS